MIFENFSDQDWTRSAKFYNPLILVLVYSGELLPSFFLCLTVSAL